jgi:N-methyltransferase StaMA
MSTSETSRVEYVGQVFDEMAELVEIQGGSIHVGYWHSDEDQAPLLEAINQCTDVVVGKLGLRPGERLLDVGCGVAVPAIRLAQRTDADIVGLTNSKWQVREGNRRVREAGLPGQVRLEYGDAADLPYPDASFDAVLALQSLQHAQDRKQWLDEMFRVLRPGGRLVIADFMEEIPLSAQEGEILQREGMEIPLPIARITGGLAGSGFVVDEALAVGDRIRRSYPAYFERLERIRDELVVDVGPEKVDMQERAMRELLPIYHDKIGFVIATSHKPQ